MSMTIGQLRHLLTLQRPMSASDGIGGQPEGTPQTVGTAWAHIEGMSGRERISADGVVGEVSHRVTIRYRGDVAPTMRLLWGQRVLEIVRAYDPTGRRQWLEMETVMQATEAGGFLGSAFDSGGFDAAGAA